jgi:hypothetical protein
MRHNSNFVNVATDPLHKPAGVLEDPSSSWCARAKRRSSTGALAMDPLKSRSLGVKSAFADKRLPASQSFRLYHHHHLYRILFSDIFSSKST